MYRLYIKSDTALLSVLGQIVQLDDKLDAEDVVEMRELVALYDKLGRHRDLITNQMKLAEITPDIEEKKELYRSAARRWLEPILQRAERDRRVRGPAEGRAGRSRGARAARRAVPEAPRLGATVRALRC